MIADLINEHNDVRLITKNVMSVYSTNKEYTDNFIRKLKHSSYKVNNKTISSDEIICYVKKTYNIYENIYRFVERHQDINTDKFIEYLNYFNKYHLLWMHFYQLSKNDLSLIEILLQLSSNKQIIIIDYIDSYEYKDHLYSLLFNVGLDDKLVIVPFTNIIDAVNNSTCQCYVKSDNAVKVMSRFPNEFINYEFDTHIEYYTGKFPQLYCKSNSTTFPCSYKYSIYELLLIFLFSIKFALIKFNNWRLSYNVD